MQAVSKVSGVRGFPVFGRMLLAIAIFAFGVQYLIYAHGGLGFGPPWTPASLVPSFLMSATFLASSSALLLGRSMRLSGNVLGAAILIRAVGVLLPGLLANLHSPERWTGGFELLGIAGGCFVLAATGMERNDLFARIEQRVALAGKLLFTVSLIVFGVQHLMYPQFVAQLIPSWIPEHLFFAYFTGIGFLASALAIMTGKLATQGRALLGAMFLIWVLILHAPRVALAPMRGDEWTSLFVALAMSGSAFIGIRNKPAKSAP